MPDLVLLDIGDLFPRGGVSNVMVPKGDGEVSSRHMTYLGMGADLGKGLLVHMDGIGVEVIDVVGLLDANGIAAVQAARVDIAGPAHVALEVGSANAALESDDVLVGDVLGLAGLLAGGRSEGGREQGSEEES